MELSVITINFNDKAGLQKTLASLAEQTWQDFELIVIDAASTDGSLDVIHQYQHKINYWVSEKDKGIYDAQNKGIRVAKGKYLMFLNSGDHLVDDRVLQEFYEFCKGNDYGIVYGNTKLLKENGEFHHDVLQPDPLYDFYFYKNTLNHQSCFIARKLFDKYGLYKLEYRICADFEFFLNVYLHETEAYVHMNRFIAYYSLGGFSSNPMNYELVVKDKEAILTRYFPRRKLREFAALERKQHSLGFNLKTFLYKNRITYPVIKLYVKLKGGGEH